MIECNEFRNLKNNLALRRLRKVLPPGSNIGQVILTAAGKVSQENRRGEPDYLLVGIEDYGAKGQAHAISMKLLDHGTTVYVFNPHGVSSIMPSVEKKLAKMLYPRARKILRYNGVNLQADDPVGLCVGYSSNFLTMTPELESVASKVRYIKKQLELVPQETVSIDLIRGVTYMAMKRPRNDNTNNRPRRKIARIGSPMNINR